MSRLSYAITLATVTAAAMIIGTKRCGNQPASFQNEINPDTVRVVHTDTIIRITPRCETVRIRDTVTLIIPAANATETPDSIAVMLPREQRVYADSNYRAVVSGINVSLDSICINHHTTTITTTRTRMPRWVIGPSVGLVWTGKQFTPAVGISLTYRFVAF